MRRFIHSIAYRAFTERCARYQHERIERIHRNLELVIDYYTDKEWPLGLTRDARVDGLATILSTFNAFGAWDVREGFTRLLPGIEETLLFVEPPVVFARLHGKWLNTLDGYIVDRHGLRPYAEKYGADPNQKSIATVVVEAHPECMQHVN